jgi:RNA polymerase sigma-70 factor (ECF subfamily)
MAIDQPTKTAFAAGSPDALPTIYAAFGKQVFTVTMSMLGNRTLAEESVQQTFLNTWRHAGSFDPTRPIAPWLYSIA